jgi:HPt (histidine-containing phosphotransfer) domain-containing protein
MAELRWNKEFALEQVAGDADLLQELIEIFQDSCTSDCSLIRAGLENGEAGKIADAAHSIKGAAASLGFEAIRGLALEMEKDGRAGRTEVAQQRLNELEELLLELKNL